MPDALELTFSSNPLALGSEVAGQDPDGQNRAVGDIKIMDNTVSQPISPDVPAGKYTVIWRVVSSDSHPIEGTCGFTATTGGKARHRNPCNQRPTEPGTPKRLPPTRRSGPVP